MSDRKKKALEEPNAVAFQYNTEKEERSKLAANKKIKKVDSHDPKIPRGGIGNRWAGTRGDN